MAPPTDRDRKQETGTGSKHPTQQVQTQGWTDGRTDGRTKRADGRAPLYLCRLLQRCRRDAVKKRKKKLLEKEKKSYRSVYVPKFGSYFAFLIFKPCSLSSKWKTMKKVLIFVTSWISLCRHINFTTIKIGWHLVFLNFRISCFNVFIFFIFGGRGRGRAGVTVGQVRVLLSGEVHTYSDLHTKHFSKSTVSSSWFQTNVANIKAFFSLPLHVFQ